MYKIEIGNYYTDTDGDLVYAFDTGNLDDCGFITDPPDKDNNPQTINVTGVKVNQIISKEHMLNFRSVFSIVTVYTDSMTSIYEDEQWTPANPPDDVRKRFQSSVKSLRLIKKYVDYMSNTFKDEMCAKDIYK